MQGLGARARVERDCVQPVHVSIRNSCEMQDVGIAEAVPDGCPSHVRRSEEHTSELQSLMRISYAVFCLKKKKKAHTHEHQRTHNHHTHDSSVKTTQHTT